MQKQFLHALAALLFVLLMGTPAAHAEDSPHQSSLGCTSCHLDIMNNAQAGITGVNNLCLSCHNPAKMSRSFNIKDMANPFGSTDLGAYTTEPLQTSHNWAAPVNVPGAGAQTPVNETMKNLLATQQGVISCASCHDKHGWPGQPGSNPKLLWLPMDSDQLCFDCHRSRNTRSHLTGTHPVNFNYTSATSKVKTRPGDYYPLPVSSNPSNPTAAMKLSGGKVNCSTCHSVHFTDSNSATFDSHSSSVLGKLTASQGYLLRTDMRGASATSINICTNCHTNKTAHNYKGQNIQCADCHAGHVDAGDGTKPNVWLVRRYMNYSGGVKLDSYRKPVFFQYTGSKRNLAGPFGVCQSCHTVPTGDAYPPEHSSIDAEVCASCHSHNSSSGSFSGGCTSCHGMPPTQNVPAGPNGYAKTGSLDYAISGVFKDETKTGHSFHVTSTYAYKCAECHAGNKHASGDFQQVFVAKTGIIAATNGFVPQYNKTTSNCSNLYCHSNGNGGAPFNSTFTWTSPKGSLSCTGCHGSTPTSANPIATGKHSAHVSGLACTECHASTISSSTTFSNRNNHVNGMKDYSGSRAGSYNNATKQCSNVYCHSNGNPKSFVYANPAPWNSSVTYGCNGCHGTGNTLGAPDYANTGAGSLTANSHNAHTSGYADTGVCSNCHFTTASTTGGQLATNSVHLNKAVNVVFDPTVAGPSASYDPATGTCNNIACHGNAPAQWGSKGGCLGCHAGSINKRAAITPQFGGNSHHVQDVNVTGEHCFQCHWEANSDGSINRTYHHSSTPGGPVELVIYGAGVRPSTYAIGTTAVQYTANGSRTEMAKINSVCISCHSDQNKTVQPFGDGKTPAIYAWDGSSIGNKYADTTTTPWGKYTGTKITPKNTVTKAFSAHGNAGANKGGWNTSETWTDRGATANVLCFDCHNSHGSNISGTTTSYASATVNGGILKETEANKGGYTVTYKPAAGGSSAEKNTHAPGAGLCFDCHMKDSATNTPWGYQSTYGATQQVMSYWDSAYFGNSSFGNQSRYPYKSITPNMGGHFGASATLTSPALHGIGGLCTPCHDPHGVSPVLGSNKQYGVPLLKGTWLTSPYKEDAATADNTVYRYLNSPGDDDAPSPASSSTRAAYQAAINSYHIDQNTFSTATNYNAVPTGIVETDVQFGGLCLRCHTKNNLTDGTTHTWKNKNRIHEAVKGWKTANTTKQHSYSCSKCHTVHNAELPKLMVTNCLDATHRGRVGYNASPNTMSSYTGEEGRGGGRFPGSYYGGEEVSSARYGWGGGSTSYSSSTTTNAICHDNYDAKQLWNTVTPWSSSATPPSTGPTTPVLVAEPNATCSSSCATALQWNASTNTGGASVQYYVQVSSSSAFTTINYSSGWISGTSYTPTLANGTWYWRVQARDSVATTKVSSWSAVGSFTLSGTALSTTPTKPVLNPMDDSTCASSSCGFTLTWNPSAISSGSIQYYVQVSASSSFSTIKANSGWISGTSYTPSLGTGTWYWRVQARSASSTSRISGYSTADSFVVSTAPPTPTVPSTPAITAEPDSSCTTGSCGIALAWNASSLTGGSAQYSVEVSNSSTFGTITAASDWITGTSYTPSLSTGTWYWRVQARNASSTSLVSAWSTVDSFVVSVAAPSTTPPSKPVLSAEPDGSCRTYSGCSIGLNWNASTNPSGGSVEYMVQVSSSSTFTSIRTQSTWQIGRTWTPVLPSGTWYWRVQARDAANALTSLWSNVDSFRLSSR